MGSLSKAVSFPIAVVSAMSRTNIPAMSKFVMTAFGHGFGSHDVTQRVRLGDSACEYSTWLSDSSTVCRSGIGIGLCRTVKVALASIVGSSEASSSYDTAKITRISPTSGTVLDIPELYINGINFFVDPSYIKIHIGSTVCPISLVSDKTVVCQLAEGIGKLLDVAVNISGHNIAI
jgi:hypothetical protein